MRRRWWAGLAWLAAAACSGPDAQRVAALVADHGLVARPDATPLGPARLVGRLTSAGGAPVSGVELLLAPLPAPGDVHLDDLAAPLRATSGEQGRFAFERGRFDGPWLLLADPGGFATHARVVDFTAGPGGAGTTFDLGALAPPEPRVVRGRVVDGAGLPVAGARVRAFPLPLDAIATGLASVDETGYVALPAASPRGTASWNAPAPPAARWTIVRLASEARALLDLLPVPATTTDAAGNFRIAAARDDVHLAIDGGGLAPVALGPLDAAKPATPADADASLASLPPLARATSLVVRVAGPAGRPLEGVSVMAASVAGRHPAAFHAAATTGADGLARLSPLASGTHLVAALAPGAVSFTLVEHRIVAGDSGAPLELVCPAPELVPLRGRGIDDRTRQGVVVSVRPAVALPAWLTGETARVAGGYVPRLAPGAWHVHAWSAEGLVGYGRVVLDGDEREIPFDLGPACAIEVAAERADGEPARGARVDVAFVAGRNDLGGGAAAAPPAAGVAHAFTGADGRARVTHLPVGRYRVSVRDESGAVASADVDVPAAKDEVRVRVPAACAVEGTVSENGVVPADRFSVRGGGSVAATDAGGRFVLRGLAPGRHVLELRRDARAPAEAIAAACGLLSGEPDDRYGPFDPPVAWLAIDVNAGAPVPRVTCDVGAATAAGGVLSGSVAIDGVPAPGLVVLAGPAEAASDARVVAARTDGAGRFALPAVGADALVTVLRPAGAFGGREPDVLWQGPAPTKAGSALALDLETTMVQGVVTAEGAPAPGVLVRASGSAGGVVRASTWTAGDGSFRIAVPVAGPIVLEARRAGTVTAAVTVQGGGEHVELALGRVVDTAFATGRVAPGLLARLESGRARAVVFRAIAHPGFEQTAPVDPKTGAFVAGPLVPGRYEVSCAARHDGGVAGPPIVVDVPERGVEGIVLDDG